MTIRVAAAAFAAASLLAIAACDSRDYEAEIATLQSDLQSAQSKNQQLQSELDGMRAKAEQALPEGARDKIQTELNNVVQTAATSFQRMGAMTEHPDAPAEQRTEALGALRQDMQTIVQSIQLAAQDLGVELETVAMDTDADAMEGTPQSEPAAGAKEPQQEPAVQDQQPATSQ